VQTALADAGAPWHYTCTASEQNEDIVHRNTDTTASTAKIMVGCTCSKLFEMKVSNDILMTEDIKAHRSRTPAGPKSAAALIQMQPDEIVYCVALVEVYSY
jgi:hypothetical protein